LLPAARARVATVLVAAAGFLSISGSTADSLGVDFSTEVDFWEVLESCMYFGAPTTTSEKLTPSVKVDFLVLWLELVNTRVPYSLSSSRLRDDTRLGTTTVENKKFLLLTNTNHNKNFTTYLQLLVDDEICAKSRLSSGLARQLCWKNPA
jgi:hypothetical protein